MNATVQNYNPWLHRFIMVTAIATFLLLGSGGMVTSHEAGMSVPDWPNTYGYNMFLFPVSKWMGGIFYEHTHRLLASGIGFLTTVLVVWLWFKDSRKWMRWLGVLAFVLVALQGVLGGLRVTLHLDKLGIVHGALAQLFFVLVCALALFTSRWWQNQGRAGSPQPADGAMGTSRPTDKNLRTLVLATTVLIFLQLILGATMRHQHAGLAIPDFPLAYDKIWPDTSAAAVAHYNANRVEVISENPITAGQIILQMAHRIVAVLVLICVGAVTFCSRRCQSAERAIAPPTHVGGYESKVAVRLSLFWLALIVVQIALGAWTIWSNKAADVATAHVLVGALALVTGALWCVVAFRRWRPLPRVESAGTLPDAFGAHPAMAGNK
ncbi:MAG: COX15/CtaA family protein [Verrucomicrobiota bacterium]|jgi:cytochrome c oxidase assembly protein subunit 15